MKPLAHSRQLFLFLALLSLGFPEASLSESSDKFLDPSEDYGDLYNPPTMAFTARPPGPTRLPEPCYKDLCQDLPAPCAQLAAETGCSCPGVSMGPRALPEAPSVKVFWRAGAEPEVRWCAAHAQQTVYRVLVGGQLVESFDDLKRSMVVAGLSAGTEVCVQAVNEVGASAPRCEAYKPPKKGASLAVMVGLIVGALGLLLLVTLAVLLWRHRSRRKDGARVSTEGSL
ncbi:leucine-rich repeat neuronal protein 4 isoform X2 [Sardina pilchardus]